MSYGPIETKTAGYIATNHLYNGHITFQESLQQICNTANFLFFF
jgi:hypothetical protein